MHFEPDEPLAAIIRGKAAERAFAVLVDALQEVRGDPGVDRAVEGAGMM